VNTEVPSFSGTILSSDMKMWEFVPEVIGQKRNERWKSDMKMWKFVPEVIGQKRKEQWKSDMKMWKFVSVVIGMKRKERIFAARAVKAA
jgi:hypothetical protein